MNVGSIFKNQSVQSTILIGCSRKHMIILTDGEKNNVTKSNTHSWQTLFECKSRQELSQPVEKIYKTPHLSLYLLDKVFPSVWRQKGYSLSPLLFNMVMKILFSATRQEKKTKDIWMGKEDVKPCLFPDDRIVYVKSLKESTKNLRIHELSSHRTQD